MSFHNDSSPIRNADDIIKIHFRNPSVRLIVHVFFMVKMTKRLISSFSFEIVSASQRNIEKVVESNFFITVFSLNIVERKKSIPLCY